jgi:hypothetical protein
MSIQTSKAVMKTEIEELQSYRRLSEHVFALLSSGQRSDLILEQLRNGKDLELISAGLPGAPLHAGALTGRPSGGDNRLSDTDSTWRGAEQSRPEVTSWTTVTRDSALIDHLMSLYFCWEYPIFASLSKPYFLEDFRSGRSRYCSPLLVNAILAVGYQFSRKPEGKEDGDVLNGQFTSAAEQLLAMEENNPSLTTIQALGMMSILEASEGNDKRSVFYCGQSIRMAVGMGLHLDVSTTELPEDEREVRRATVWGAYALDQ